MTQYRLHPAAGRRVSGEQCSGVCFRTQIFVTRSDVVLVSGITVANRKSLVVMTVLETLWGRMARFVVLVIDSFGVGAMKDARWCVRKMRERIPVVTS